MDSTIRMYGEEITPCWFPFHGLPDGVAPTIRVGNVGGWSPMVLDASYIPDPVLPDDEGAAWYRVVFAGYQVVTPPVGAIVCAAGRRKIRFKVATTGQVDIQPDPPAGADDLAIEVV